jgi:hypothetical protein
MKALCLICFLNLILLASCEKKKEKDDNFQLINIEELIKRNASKVSIKMGVAGTLLKKDGNCMPMIGSSSTSCRTYPVGRSIMIYDYTTKNEAVDWGPMYNFVYSRFVAQCDADQDGFFQITVDTGRYSIFIKESDKLYANSSDGQGGINPIIVSNDSVSIITLMLDYAVY